jgi:hypothetical protein
VHPRIIKLKAGISFAPRDIIYQITKGKFLCGKLVKESL